MVSQVMSRNYRKEKTAVEMVVITEGNKRNSAMAVIVGTD
jgi:hypothetical protein